MRFIIFTFLVFSPFFLFSQGPKLELKHAQAQIFYDYLDHCFYALDDSTFIWKFDSKLNQWEKAPIILDLEIPFDEFLKDFVALSDKNCPTYFVHAGCGIVYQKLKDKIYRHDKSFKHMNQFSGSFFIDDGEPRIFGGFGLFTIKNIISRYDTVSREWFELEAPGKRPKSLYDSYIFKDKDGYLLIGGKYQIDGIDYLNKELWFFNKKKSNWQLLESISNRSFLEMLIQLSKQSKPRLSDDFICSSDYLLSFEQQKRRMKLYKLESNGIYSRFISGENNYGLLITHFGQQKFSFEIIKREFKLNFHLKYEFSVPSAYHKSTGQEKWFLFLIIIFIGTIIFTGFMLLKNRVLIQFNHKKSFIHYKEAIFTEFSSLEKDLIKMLITNGITGLEIASINDLIDYDNPSIDTLKKRREYLIKDLKFKLSNIFLIPQDQVFIEKRMENDKRMKILFLNPVISEKIGSEFHQ